MEDKTNIPSYDFFNDTFLGHSNNLKSFASNIHRLGIELRVRYLANEIPEENFMTTIAILQKEVDYYEEQRNSIFCLRIGNKKFLGIVD